MGLIDSKWIDPDVRGSCTPRACGGACCRVKTYSDSKNYTESWCPHFNQIEIKCEIYEDRWEGCRRYPTAHSLKVHGRHEGCGYYLADDS